MKYSTKQIARLVWQELKANKLQATNNTVAGLLIVGLEFLFVWLTKQTIDIAQRLCLTEIHDTPAEADTFFPPYDDWQESTRECHTADEQHQYAYDFVDYVRS